MSCNRFLKGGAEDLPPPKPVAQPANPMRQRLSCGAVIPFSYPEKQVHVVLRQALRLFAHFNSQLSSELSVLAPDEQSRSKTQSVMNQLL